MDRLYDQFFCVSVSQSVSESVCQQNGFTLMGVVILNGLTWNLEHRLGFPSCVAQSFLVRIGSCSSSETGSRILIYIKGNTFSMEKNAFSQISRKRLKLSYWTQTNTNRKPPMACRLVPSRMTSDDLERPKVKGQGHEYLSSNNSKTVRDTMLVTIDNV